MARHFTREAFHALVWSKPMTTLAKEFAISDVALHKICRKHAIPTPPAGWWAKQQAGKPVRVTPLPPAVDGSTRGITIAAGHLGAETSMVAAAREAARLRAADAVPAPGTDPIVARTMARLAKAKPSDIGIVSVADPDLIECEVAVASVERLGQILEGLAAAAATQGFRIAPGERTAGFRSGDETIRFSVKETIKREKHVLTPAEVVKEEAWRAKQERAARRNAWDALFIDRPRFADWDYHPTGQLSIELETVYVSGQTAPRRTFRDTRTQRLENLAIDVGVAIAVLAAAKTQERLRREEAARRAEEERLRRERAAREAFIGKRRDKALTELLGQVEELDRLRTLVALLSKGLDGTPAPRVAALLAHARERIVTLEANLSDGGLEERLNDACLFGDDDDRDFLVTRWN